MDNFLVKMNYDQSVSFKSEVVESSETHNDANAFMKSVEKDANRRASERKQREIVAQELRK